MPVVTIQLSSTPRDAQDIRVIINGVTYVPNQTPGVTYPGPGGDDTIGWDDDNPELFVIDANDTRIEDFR